MRTLEIPGATFLNPLQPQTKAKDVRLLNVQQKFLKKPVALSNRWSFWQLTTPQNTPLCALCNRCV